jgi:NTE family protein
MADMDSTNGKRLRPGTARKPIGLALQGGGSWGAYTWGVLDTLLASRSVRIAQLSGTSAGAINAAIVTSELAKGSRAEARKALRSFWLSIADPVASNIVGGLWSPLERQWRNSMNDWLLTSGLMSLYNPTALGIHPLRDAIAAHVDIDAIRSPSAPALFITITNVRTGLPRVISNRAMSIEALLASTSLPDLFPAVELDGEHYWDGGYGGNPTLWPMIRSRLADDLIIVQLAPDRIEEVSTDAPAIRRRVGEIVFHSSLVAEMQSIHAMRVVAEPGKTRLAKLRFHRIGPPRPELFEQGNGVERARPWLQLLHAEGLAAGRQFIARHGVDIGIRETLDVAGAFIDTHKPKIRMPANESFHDRDATAMSEAA